MWDGKYPKRGNLNDVSSDGGSFPKHEGEAGPCRQAPELMRVRLISEMRVRAGLKPYLMIARGGFTQTGGEVDEGLDEPERAPRLVNPQGYACPSKTT